MLRQYAALSHTAQNFMTVEAYMWCIDDTMCVHLTEYTSLWERGIRAGIEVRINSIMPRAVVALWHRGLKMEENHNNVCLLRDAEIVSLDLIGPFVVIFFSNGETVTLATADIKQVALEHAIDDFANTPES